MEFKKILLGLMMIAGIVVSIFAMEPQGKRKSFKSEEPAKRQRIETLPEEIRVKTSDNESMLVFIEVAQSIPTLNHLIDVLKDNGELFGENVFVPLAEVASREFKWIVRTLTILQNNPNEQIDMEWLSVEQLVMLANACEYLDLEQLQNLLLEELAKHDLVANALEPMYPDVLKKFWKLHSRFSYAYMLNAVSLREEFETLVDAAVVGFHGNRLISWSTEQGTIKVWNLQTGKQMLPNLIHNQVDNVLVSQNGTKFVSFSPIAGTSDTAIKIWDLINLNQAPRELSQEHLEEIKISQDGSKLFLRCGGRVVQTAEEEVVEPEKIVIWDLDNPDEDAIELQHRGMFGFVVNDTKVVFWSGLAVLISDLDHLDQDVQMIPQQEDIATVDISSDNRMLIIRSYDEGIISLVDLQGDNQQPREIARSIVKFYINNDSSELFVWSRQEKQIMIFNLFDIDQVPHRLPYAADIDGIFTTSDDTKLIVWPTRGGWGIQNAGPLTVSIWDLNNLDLNPREIPYPFVGSSILGPALSGTLVSRDNNKLIIWASNQELITIWDLHNPDKKPWKLYRKLSTAYPLGGVILTPHRMDMVSWKQNRKISVWSINVLDQFDNLNSDHIKLMIWIYNHKNMRPQEVATFDIRSIPNAIKNAYATLQDNLKRPLQRFPIVQVLNS
jgi:WD40 repeat protein